VPPDAEHERDDGDDVDRQQHDGTERSGSGQQPQDDGSTGGSEEQRRGSPLAAQWRQHGREPWGARSVSGIHHARPSARPTSGLRAQVRPLSRRAAVLARTQAGPAVDDPRTGFILVR
jgi:hypothetical protein